MTGVQTCALPIFQRGEVPQGEFAVAGGGEGVAVEELGPDGFFHQHEGGRAQDRADHRACTAEQHHGVLALRARARDATGTAVSGLVAANSPQDALAQLAARQLFPLKIDLAESSKAQQKQISRRVPARHLAGFYSQLADLLKSGVPLLRSLELLESQTRQPALKAVLSDVRAAVADGSRLYDAMRVHPRAFSELICRMIRAGAEGGFLEDVLKRVATITDHQEEMKGSVIGALVYPLFLVVVGSTVVSVLIVFFVPKFAPTFDRMKERGELPWATTALMSISATVQGYWIYGLLVLVGGLYGIYRYLQTAARTKRP